MNANAKAATFTGWKPDVRCLREDWVLFDGCPECGFFGDLGPHNRALPDMSDPRNYMKALNELVARGLYIDFCLYLAVSGPYARITVWPKEGKVSDTYPPLAEAREKIAECPIVLLAALYDAEHQDPAE